MTDQAPARLPVVRAAGGVLLRQSAGIVELLCVHRPDRDDWSMPKGKLLPDERFVEGAVREVLEETGYACVPRSFAGSTEYTDRGGRRKVVAYWHMTPAPGTSFDDAPSLTGSEVDEARWMATEVALASLSYRPDRALAARILGAAGSPG